MKRQKVSLWVLSSVSHDYSTLRYTRWKCYIHVNIVKKMPLSDLTEHIKT